MQKNIFILLLAVSTVFVFSCKSETKTNTNDATTTTTTKPTEGTPVANDQTNYKVDAAQSVLMWVGSKAVGDEHKGTIKLKDGEFLVTEGTVMAGQATIDMNSIDNKDLEGNWKLKLEKHLKSPDFFDVATYPTATINIKRDGDNGYDGELTLRGVTKPIKIAATVALDNKNYIVTLQPFKIDRTEWGVKYNSGKFFENLKDKLISDDIQISGKIVLTHK